MNRTTIREKRNRESSFSACQQNQGSYTQTLNIGAKVKQLRLDNKMTLQAVSQKTGLSTSLISQIENNNVSPPIATLSKISSFFNVRLSMFFVENDDDSRFEVVHANRRKAVVKLVNPVGAASGSSCESLSFRLIHKKMEPFLLTVREKALGDTSVSHAGEVFLHIIKGNLDLILDNQSIALAAGDSVYFDSSLQHQIVTKDDHQVEVLTVIAR